MQENTWKATWLAMWTPCGRHVNHPPLAVLLQTQPCIAHDMSAESEWRCAAAGGSAGVSPT